MRRCDKRAGQVVSALDFPSEGRWSEPGLRHCVVSFDNKLCLWTEEYTWVPATESLRKLAVTLRWTSHPSKRRSTTSCAGRLAKVRLYLPHLHWGSGQTTKFQLYMKSKRYLLFRKQDHIFSYPHCATKTQK